MFDIRAMFPRASKSTIEANPNLSDTNSDKTSSRPPVGPANGKRGKMNKTESEFADRLQLQKQLGEIRDYLFHPLSLPWGMNDGDAMEYTPDFMVTPSSGREKRKLIEVKGPHIHYRQQAVARFKGCRGYWPEFDFEMWQQTEQGWKRIY